MYRKIICLLVLMCLILCGCSKQVSKENQYNVIKKRGKIIVGVRSDTRPFGYRDINGNLHGFDIDLARAIAKHIFADSHAVEFVPVTASDRIKMLNSKKVDCLIATMSITEQRRMVVDFSEPYYVAGQAILVKNRAKIHSIRQLDGKKVIVVYGSTGEEILRLNAPQAIIRGYKNYERAYNALKRGEASALIADDTVLYNLAIDDPSVRILEQRFSKEPYAVAFRRGDESAQLKDSVNFILSMMEHSGQLREMKRKWGIWK